VNKLIQELAEQATTRIEPTSNSGEGWIFDKEKFSELIVRECIDVVRKATTSPNGYQALMKHFGVEE